jgi:spermidine synthase
MHHPPRLAGEPLRSGSSASAPAPSPATRLGDSVRFYEINPDVVALSSGKDPLHLPARLPRQVEVALGDARVNLEREPDQGFDVLALDAFSSDSIPAHLLTVEAVQLYLRHLRDPDSVLAVHISNRYLDLDPVVRGIADSPAEPHCPIVIVASSKVLSVLSASSPARGFSCTFA